MASGWKQVERDLSKTLPGGKRWPSQGIAHPDVESDEYTFEVKARQRANFPGWMLNAFDQRILNAAVTPSKLALNLFSVHFGKGNPQRWFIATEVQPRNGSEVLDAIDALIEAQLRLTPDEDAPEDVSNL